jgi:hypothetical protein
MDDDRDPVERAMDAVRNQFSMMCHERWLAAKRIRALKAEMARRAEEVMDSRGTPLFEPKVSAFVCTATVVLFALAVVGLVTLVHDGRLSGVLPRSAV